MGKQIYILNYGTSQYHENNVGDKYYCKSLTSVKKVIVREMKNEGYKNKEIKECIDPLLVYMMNKKTMINRGNIKYLNIGELFIIIQKLDIE